MPALDRTHSQSHESVSVDRGCSTSHGDHFMTFGTCFRSDAIHTIAIMRFVSNFVKRRQAGWTACLIAIASSVHSAQSQQSKPAEPDVAALDVKGVKAQALEALADRTVNAPARHYCPTAAQQLRNGTRKQWP